MRFLGGLYSTSQRNQARVDEAARAPRHDPAKKLVMWPLEFPCGGGEADCDSVESTAGWIGRCSGKNSWSKGSRRWMNSLRWGRSLSCYSLSGSCTVSGRHLLDVCAILMGRRTGPCIGDRAGTNVIIGPGVWSRRSWQRARAPVESMSYPSTKVPLFVFQRLVWLCSEDLSRGMQNCCATVK